MDAAPTDNSNDMNAIMSFLVYNGWSLFFVLCYRKIEEKRGISITEAGEQNVKAPPLLLNGLHSVDQLPQKSATIQNSSKKNNTPAWDEDWDPSASSSAKPKQPVVQPPLNPNPNMGSSFQPIDINLGPQVTGLTAASCMPVDVEWPPSTSSDNNDNNNNNKHNSKQAMSISGTNGISDIGAASSNGGFDDLDPFANWPPPKQSNPTGQLKPVQNLHSTSNSSMNSNSSGMFNQHKSLFSINYTAKPVMSNPSQDLFGSSVLGSNIGSKLGSTNGIGSTPRLAPPPQTSSVGRGRGRNQGQSALSRATRPVGNAKSTSDQAPLFDLLQ
jgi:SCY1-like protein 2